MKKLFFLALVAVAAWYGWNHKDSLFERKDSHEALVENDTGEPIQRIRLIVDGQGSVKELLQHGESVTLPFRVTSDSDFQLKWEWTQRPGEMSWRGGMVAAGPMTQVHRFIVRGENTVIYQVEQKTRPADP